MKVLLADDELRLRKVVVLHLKKAGFDVIEASNGKQAVELAKIHNPEIIVLDVMMPEMDGITACKEFRKSPEFAKTPIIMLTAKATSDDIEVGKSAGASEYLTKPFSPKELIEKIQELMGNG
ncbi:response regulator transcription factor [Calditerrivibrio nitroreducens]|uniref:Response regulator receiver protein n=1 Tax=Calditerrivibrio nitroreducens (strain DSM 19672 / NBRC 101217 / Yu37-1) TaxID=768670 RepID=E4TG87_CALNY|nr:response regulator [Calditerrivibrio nitroreducens]ADR19674.1 response regulator receiver protein [Calditerrivibrio nitroreducens DSM 19672]